MTEASFVLVARDPLNVGSAFVNPLIAETVEEKRLIARGEENKQSRCSKRRLMLSFWRPSVDFIIVLQPAFAPVEPKSVKRF